MDRCNMESGDRMYKDVGGLPALLCRNDVAKAEGNGCGQIQQRLCGVAA